MQNLFKILAAKATQAATQAGTQGGTDTDTGAPDITSLIFTIAIFGLVMYFMMIRPQKKRQKQEEKLRNSLQVGDQIVTIGGIHGKIVALKEDSVIIETGPTRSQIQFSKYSIQENKTVHDEEESK